MRRFEITIDGVAQGDYATLKEADAAAAIEHAKTGKLVLGRRKAEHTWPHGIWRP